MKRAILDLTAYQAWYKKNVPTGVFMWTDKNILIEDHETQWYDQQGYHIHNLEMSLGCGFVPKQFITVI